MGNNPSTPTTGSSSSKFQAPPSAESSTSPRTPRNPHRSPITVGHTSHAQAAPPEATNAFAQGQSVPTRAGFGHLQQHYRYQKQQHQHQHRAQQQKPAVNTGAGASQASRYGASSPAQPPQLAQGGALGSAPPERPLPPDDFAASKAVPIPTPDATRPIDAPHTAGPSAGPAHMVAADAEADAQLTSDESIFFSDLTPTMMAGTSVGDPSYHSRPPRLPLPIEDELKTPGSPITGPTEATEIIDDEGDILSAKPAAVIEEDDGAAREDTMTRKSSGTTADTADDAVPGDWGGGDGAAGDRQVVPTRFEWLGGGQKVFVTGTIFHWGKKYRLRPIEGRPGCFAETINVVTGTHHIRFLVDNVMTTSEHMPTTVDLANNLVNYIIVSAADADKRAREAAAAEMGRESATESGAQQGTKLPKVRHVPPSSEYLLQIPQYLSDFDSTEENATYRRAVLALDKLPSPPLLPGFLAKPILNAPMPAREDNSVLILPPNHTVLNHLATCSIKNNILSVSVTTRYKSKFVTTIMYKPSTING